MASLQSAGFLPVATAGLAPAAVLACDLFIQHRGKSHADLYRAQSYPLDDKDLDALRQDGVNHLYIRLVDADLYRSYLCEHVLHQENIPAAARLRALREVTRVAFEGAMSAGDSDKLVSVAKDFGGTIADIIADRSPAFDELFKTLEHDYYTFTHVCNVSLYCTLNARSLGTFSSGDLAELATAGLLHDLGKRYVPQHILCKKEKLTDEEWALIMEHPATGFRDLAARGDMTWAQLMVVYQHHEKLNGSGYPTGITDTEIHPWAKLCAVADVFDAMTCPRPYRKALGAKAACEHLKQRSGVWFDAALVKSWINLVEAGHE